MNKQEITVALEVTRVLVRKATQKQILELLADNKAGINQARLKMLEYIDKAAYGGKEDIELRRDELLAVIDICEPIIEKFSEND